MQFKEKIILKKHFLYYIVSVVVKTLQQLFPTIDINFITVRQLLFREKKKHKCLKIYTNKRTNQNFQWGKCILIGWLNIIGNAFQTDLSALGNFFNKYSIDWWSIIVVLQNKLWGPIYVSGVIYFLIHSRRHVGNLYCHILK